MSTTAHQLADLRTDGQLATIVAEARTRGESWRAIARRLYVDHGVDVTDNTLRSWFSDR